MPSNVLRTTIPENNSLAPLVTGSDNGRAAARAKLAVSMNHVADTLEENSSYDDDDDSAVDAYMLSRNKPRDQTARDQTARDLTARRHFQRLAVDCGIDRMTTTRGSHPLEKSKPGPQKGKGVGPSGDRQNFSYGPNLHITKQPTY